MSGPELTHDQLSVVSAPLRGRVFLHGPAGNGKSTAGVARLKLLLESGVPGENILVLTPQRTLQDTYLALIHSPESPAGGEVTPLTVGGLARRMCDLFWPLAAEKAGFSRPDRPPSFLTLESSQYYMAHIVRPLLEEGYFESVTMDRNRLYSQILDSLNKSAAVGFPSTEIGSRLDSAWFGDPGQRRIYADAQDCATRFREFCLQHNLLDFSLQLDFFWKFLWPDQTVRNYLLHTYRHMIYDNIEEDVPRAHDLLHDWLPVLESVLLIYDEGAGYRHFLGADVHTAWALRELCETEVAFHDSFVMSKGIERLGASLAATIDTAFKFAGPRQTVETESDREVHLRLITARFYPDLLDRIVEEIRGLVIDSGRAPSEIVILAPYLSDALRFALTSRLEAGGLPWRTLRPSRSLRDESAAQALLTLAALAHPQWNVRPSPFDVAYAFMQALGTDLVRAQLLAEIVYRAKNISLSSFDDINPEKQERITFVLGNRYSILRDWLQAYRLAGPLPLDHFLRRLFGEVLSQPGFGFHRNLDAARVAGSLVESVRKFRLAMEPAIVDVDHPDFDLGHEYINMLQDGVLAALYLDSWKAGSETAVLVAPAYSFLMMNRPASVQFWLDPGSSGWYQRLDQPLTHSQVLSREWPEGNTWTFADEERANSETMARLVLGLVRRCRDRIYLGISDLGEGGFEQRGRLLYAFQSVLNDNLEQ